MDEFRQVFGLFGYTLQTVGMLVFGLASGWFTMYAFKHPERRWQLQTAVFLGFFVFVALIVKFASPGSTGAYTLGAGVAIIIWGLLKSKDEIVEVEIEEEKD